jgi:hypothetical protein
VFTTVCDSTLSMNRLKSRRMLTIAGLPERVNNRTSSEWFKPERALSVFHVAGKG